MILSLCLNFDPVWSERTFAAGQEGSLSGTEKHWQEFGYCCSSSDISITMWSFMSLRTPLWSLRHNCQLCPHPLGWGPVGNLEAALVLAEKIQLRFMKYKSCTSITKVTESTWSQLCWTRRAQTRRHVMSCSSSLSFVVLCYDDVWGAEGDRRCCVWDGSVCLTLGRTQHTHRRVLCPVNVVLLTTLFNSYQTFIKVVKNIHLLQATSQQLA